MKLKITNSTSEDFNTTAITNTLHQDKFMKFIKPILDNRGEDREVDYALVKTFASWELDRTGRSLITPLRIFSQIK